MIRTADRAHRGRDSQLRGLGRKSRSEVPASGFVVAGVIILFIILALAATITELAETPRVGCTVTYKDRVQGDEGSDMRVYTKECGTFQVRDSPLNGVWNAADVFGDIEEGQRYDFKTVWPRVPVLSMFPVIVDVAQ